MMDRLGIATGGAGELTRAQERVARGGPDGRWLTIMCVFGTRPEVIKFLPVLRELKRRRGVTPVTVLTSQHTDLVRPLIDLWKIRIDHDLQAMVAGQPLNLLVSRLLSGLDAVIAAGKPDMVLVQGDTASAMAGAMAAFHRRVPVGHIEAGLRSGLRDSPFPEEMNRRMVTSLATLHFAPTERNAATLIAEGVPPEAVVRTGNPVVDAVRLIRARSRPSPAILALLDRLAGQRILLLTTHRRESFGDVMRDRLRVLREFVAGRPDVELLFPVHPNPAVTDLARAELGGKARVHLLPPLDYPDFLHCLGASWLVVSDSGGVQEEAPSLGKPLLVIRDNTERPEAVEAGVARLVGESAERLREELLRAEAEGSWASRVRPVANPFGNGDSAARIVDAILASQPGRPVAAQAIEPAVPARAQ
ncbi:MAG: non-hydrolyzing UDP-N-acetylglucosamine 2-epimerase [Paracoccaceae bacterium]